MIAKSGATTNFFQCKTLQHNRDSTPLIKFTPTIKKRVRTHTETAKKNSKITAAQEQGGNKQENKSQQKIKVTSTIKGHRNMKTHKKE